MKKLICFVFCLISVITLFGCKKENEALNSILERGKLIVTTSPDYPPFEFIDQSKSGQDQYVGADVELMKYIAKKLDVELEIRVVDFESTLALLKTGAADLAISGYTYTAKRAENYLYSYPYDSEGTQGVLILASKKDVYKTLADINKDGLKCASQSGSLQADYAKIYLAQTEYTPFKKIAEGLLLLENDPSVACVAISSTSAESIMAANPGKYFFLEETFPIDPRENDVYVIANKGEVELINKINQIIAEIVDLGLYKQWMQDAKDLAEALAKETEDDK